MGDKFGKLFGRSEKSRDPETLGEDMVPSPVALAERSALSSEVTSIEGQAPSGPFGSNAVAPVRDFTG